MVYEITYKSFGLAGHFVVEAESEGMALYTFFNAVPTSERKEGIDAIKRKFIASPCDPYTGEDLAEFEVFARDLHEAQSLACERCDWEGYYGPPIVRQA